MNIREALENKTVEVLAVENLLFEGIGYTYKDREDNLYNKLYLIKKKRGSYAVFACTWYLSDDSFTQFLDAFDQISHPLSLDFKKEFTNAKEAKMFFKEVLKKCPSKFNLKKVLPDTTLVYSYDSRKSVHYDFMRGKVREDEFFEQEFIRHGYQRIMIRMFRLKQKIIINKNLTLEFALEEESKEIFQLLKEHFSVSDNTVFPCDNEEMEFDKLLEQLLIKSFRGNNQKIEVKRDFLERITNLKVAFTTKEDIRYDIEYRLPTRNGNYHGYTMKGSIYKRTGKSILGSDFETYDCVWRFKEDLKEILAT